MTAVRPDRQRRIAWALIALAVLGLAITVALVIALPGDWKLISLIVAVLVGLKTGAAIVLFRAEWVSWGGRVDVHRGQRR